MEMGKRMRTRWGKEGGQFWRCRAEVSEGDEVRCGIAMRSGARALDVRSQPKSEEMLRTLQ